MYILDDHDKEGQFNAECLTFVLGTGDKGGCHVCAHDLEN